MIVCVCRNISDKDFKTTEELLKRLQEDDKQCASCVTFIMEKENETYRKLN